MAEAANDTEERRPYDRILDAYEDLLIDQGERAATLAAVAEAAGISKGGLLYHFDSKHALLDGLIARLAGFTEHDAQQLRESADPITDYITGPVELKAPIDRTFVALHGLAQVDEYLAARSALHAYDVHMIDLFDELLGDRTLAHLVVRVSDGYYLQAILGLTDDDENELSDVLSLIQSLRRP